MGVRQWMRRQKFNDPVPGTFEVRSCEHGTWAGAHVELDLTGMVNLPGVCTLPAEFHGKAPHAKRPAVGQVLPVIIDRADPTQFRIEWDQVSSQEHANADSAASVVEPPQVAVSVPHAHSPAPPNWDRATATVLACHTAKVPAFAMSQAPGGIFDLVLDVKLDDGYAYSTKSRVAFSTPERRAKATGKGTELPVRVDPTDPNRVVIDIDQIPNW
jgi:hypothetical protein